MAGYRDGLRDSGVSFDRSRVAVAPSFTRQAGATAMEQLLETAPDLDAVFVASDTVGPRGARRAQRSGRRVPDDVAVIGFDDTPDASISDPPLTTVRQPIVEFGRRMAKMLLDDSTDSRRAVRCHRDVHRPPRQRLDRIHPAGGVLPS